MRVRKVISMLLILAVAVSVMGAPFMNQTITKAEENYEEGDEAGYEEDDEENYEVNYEWL